MTTADTRIPLYRQVVFAIIVLAALCVLLALGTWQMQRLGWKQDLLHTIETRTSSPAVPLSEVIGKDAGELEYTPVQLSGRFVHEAERHFFATHGGRSGYYVYTPLMLDESSAVFVNRGFVPYDRKDARLREAGQVEGVVEIEGLARSAPVEKPSSMVPDNQPQDNIFYWKDIRAMRDSSGLPPSVQVLDLFVDAGTAENPGGLPIGGVTIIDLPNNHLQYAVTWYGLAAALVAVSAIWLWRRRRQP